MACSWARHLSFIYQPYFRKHWGSRRDSLEPELQFLSHHHLLPSFIACTHHLNLPLLGQNLDSEQVQFALPGRHFFTTSTPPTVINSSRSNSNVTLPPRAFLSLSRTYPSFSAFPQHFAKGILAYH